jgi:hypothetical protein
MNDLKRRDKLFLTIFALSALVMMIANVDDIGVRSVAFDAAMVIVFVGGWIWLMSEFFDQFSGLNALTIPRRTVKKMGREEMIELAGEMTGISKVSLNGFTDVELDGIVNGTKTNGSVVGGAVGGVVPLHKIVIALLKLAIRTIVAIAKLIVSIPRGVKGAPGSFKANVARIEKLWKDEWNRS